MKKIFLNQFIIFLSKTSIMVGGQAVINGVMMRVPGFYATAVRDNNNNHQSDIAPAHNEHGSDRFKKSLKITLDCLWKPLDLMSAQFRSFSKNLKNLVFFK